MFIKSGRCQDLIPTLPIWEDEESEMGTCEILEKSLRELTNAADMVAARTRQLSHKLRGRRTAILERRAGNDKTADNSIDLEPGTDLTSPSSAAHSGFVAVNTQPAPQTNGNVRGPNGKPDSHSATAPTSVRTDLLKHFHSLSHNQVPNGSENRRPSTAALNSHAPQATHPTVSEAEPQLSSTSVSLSPAHNPIDPLSYYISDSTPARQTPSQNHSHQNPGKHNFSRPLAPALEVSQPFRAICQTHMESLPRGSRVMPPCDRCRRLRMDCLKNLTSCQGCTKKHARCHWRDVGREEVESLPGFGSGSTEGYIDDEEGMVREGLMENYGKGVGGIGNGQRHGGEESDDDEDEDGTPLDDLEALERMEQESDGDGAADTIVVGAAANPLAAVLRDNESTMQRMREDERGLEQARHLARQASQTSPVPGPSHDGKEPHDQDNGRGSEVNGQHRPMRVDAIDHAGIGSDAVLTPAVRAGQYFSHGSDERPALNGVYASMDLPVAGTQTSVNGAATIV